MTNRTAPSLPASALRWLDDRVATAVGGAQVRVGLIRLALRRRENIPELAVVALEREGFGKREQDMEAGR